MTTSISATLPPHPWSTSDRSADQGTTKAFCAPKRGSDSIADTLWDLTRSTAQRPNSQTRLITSIERLVDSVARLIEAFASYRGTTPQGPSRPERPSPKPAECGRPPTPNQSEPGIMPKPPLSGSDPKFCIPCCPGSADKPRPGSTTPNLGQALTRGGGFLWKPVSDKNGDLVVLLPKNMTSKVQEVRVLSADGKTTLETGRYSGIGNGNREHFRFSQPGSSYPDGSIVLIKLNDGTTRHTKIKETSKRVER